MKGIRIKQIVLFLFFLAISFFFWCFQKLNETFEVELVVPLRLTDVPKDVVITEDLPREITITVQDKGNNLISYFFNRRLEAVDISFARYADNTNGEVAVSLQDMESVLGKQLPPTSSVLRQSQEPLTFAYGRGTGVMVPVEFAGTITADDQHILSSEVKVSPSEVMVYVADKNHVPDKIVTEAVEITNVKSDLNQRVALKKLDGVHFQDATVNVQAAVDLATRGEVEVLVQPENFPLGVSLRTFPARVKVSYLVAASNEKSVAPEAFRVVVDYEEIGEDSSVCHPRLVDYPKMVARPVLETLVLDCLFETETPETADESVAR